MAKESGPDKRLQVKTFHNWSIWSIYLDVSSICSFTITTEELRNSKGLEEKKEKAWGISFLFFLLLLPHFLLSLALELQVANWDSVERLAPSPIVMVRWLDERLFHVKARIDVQTSFSCFLQALCLKMSWSHFVFFSIKIFNL